MRRLVTTAFLLASFAFSLSAFCEQPTSKWQIGTIMSVAPHAAENKNHSVPKYDVSVKVGEILYVVLYVPPHGSNAILHRAGHDILVSVGAKSIFFNDLLGRKLEAPILSQKPFVPARYVAPAQNGD